MLPGAPQGLWFTAQNIRFPWWRHQMETFPRYWPFVRGIHRSPVNSPHKCQWCGALMFSLICVWINGWVNNREAGDLRRYRIHYDVIVMLLREVIYMLYVSVFVIMQCFAVAYLVWWKKHITFIGVTLTTILRRYDFATFISHPIKCSSN